LAARRLVEFVGPLGWEHSAIDLGEAIPLEDVAAPGVLLRRRQVRPLVELRVPFQVERDEIERIDRGAQRVELSALREAARRFARAEDSALFEGWPEADIPGLVSESVHGGVALPEDEAQLPSAISEALELLREASVCGPYALALGPETHAALDRAAARGG